MSILFDNPPPAIGCGDPGDPIDFGCLFDGGQVLERAFTSSEVGEWTLSVWAKITETDRSGPSGVSLLAVAPVGGTSSNNGTWFGYMSDFSPAGFYVNCAAYSSRSIYARFDRLWRDPAAWSHIYLSYSAERPVGSRYVMRVNGELVWSAFYNSSVEEFNRAVRHAIGGHVPLHGGAAYPSTRAIFAAYHFVSGREVGFTEFVYRNAYLHWVPKRFKGDYGANGFHLDFADPLDLGKDVSGNGNHFTAIGLTVDNQVTDTPSKNCTTLNPLYADSSKITPTNGNLTAIGNAANPAANNVAGTHIIRHKAFFAMQPVALGNGSFYIGLQSADGLTYCYRQDGATVLAGAVSAYGAAFAVGDWVGCGYDPVTGNIEFFKLISGAWVSQGILPAAISAADVLPWVYASHQTRVDVNFGQRAWPAELPEGYSAHSTLSMPCPAILNPDDYFTHRIKTGGASVSDLPFNPTLGKALFVSARLDTDDPCLITSTTTGAGMAWDASTSLTGLTSRPNGITAFNPTGYSVGSDTAYQGNRLDMAWRASPRAGFDIVTINHTTGTPTTVPHVAGGLVEYAWYLPHAAGQSKRIFHHMLGNDRYFPMDEQGPSVSDPGWISSTANTITLGASMPTDVYTLPVWRSVPQFSSFGRYAPNDSTDGPFIPLDFSPRLFQPNGGGPNGMRAIFVDDLVVNGGNDQRLAFDAAEPAQTNYEYCDFLSNGVKARGVYTPINYSDTDYYYPAAWARNPGKFARAR